MGAPSRRRREGREAFTPGADPMEYCPYNKNDWYFSFKFEDFRDGWNAAQEEYYEMEQARENQEFDLSMCPWHENCNCIGSQSHCSEDACPVLYWRDK